MGLFQHHPDGRIHIEDDGGRFTYSLAEFLIDEPAYALPPGAAGRIYIQGARHALTDGRKQWKGPEPWADGDRFIANKNVYKAAYEARNPLPTPPPAPTDNERVDRQLKDDRVLQAIVRTIAAELGKTNPQIVAAIKVNMR